MGDYWLLVVGRALNKVVPVAFGGWPRFVAQLAASAVLVYLAASLLAPAVAADKAAVVLLTVVANLIVGAVVFVGYFVTTPPRIHAERGERIAALEGWEAQRNAELAALLRERYAEGQRLHDEWHDAKEWIGDLKKWRAALLADMQGKCTQRECFMVESLAFQTEFDGRDARTLLLSTMGKLRFVIDRQLAHPSSDNLPNVIV